MIGDDNLQLSSDYTYATYAQPSSLSFTTNTFGDVNIVTTINGATGPITFSSPDGFAFTGGIGGQVVFTVSNPATARTALGAAASGVNADLTELTTLTGASGWSAWTGTPDKTSHATFSGTASATYDQTEMQAVMDSLQEVTEGFMALLATLLAWGGVKT